MEPSADPACVAAPRTRTSPVRLKRPPGGRPFVSPLRRASPATPPTACPLNRETSDNSRQVLRRRSRAKVCAHVFCFAGRVPQTAYSATGFLFFRGENVRIIPSYSPRNCAYFNSIFPMRPVPLNASQIRLRVLSTDMFRTMEPGVGILIVSICPDFRSNATIVPARASS